MKSALLVAVITFMLALGSGGAPPTPAHATAALHQTKCLAIPGCATPSGEPLPTPAPLP